MKNGWHRNREFPQVQPRVARMMDPSLLKERDAFLKHAAKNVSISPSTVSARTNEKKKKKAHSVPSDLKQLRQSAAAAGQHQQRFRMIKSVVDFLKTKHLNKDYTALSLESILHEIGLDMLDVDTKEWLRGALMDNPKTEYDVVSGNFLYKPALGIRSRSELGKLLKRYDDEGLGGVTMSDVREALPKPDKAVKRLKEGGSAMVVDRPDKEQVIFYRDPNLDLQVDEDLQALWRSVSVDGMTEADISAYLQNVGIAAMEGSTTRKRKPPVQQSKGKRARRGTHKVLNVHLEEGVLREYPEPENN